MHFGESLTLIAMADFCHMPVSRFRVHFKKITGISPGSWLLHHRLNKAAQMLISSYLEVNEFASTCGFPDSNYFTPCGAFIHSWSI